MDRFVAYLDILGFKDLVEKNSLETLQQVYMRTLEASYKEGIDELKAIPGLTSEIIDSIRSIIISDSIIFWSKDVTGNSFMMITSVVREFLRRGLNEGLVLRGAISKGELEEISTDSVRAYNAIPAPIILGKALVRAYTLESMQQWSGCIICDDVIRCLDVDPLSEEAGLLAMVVRLKWIIPYKVPLKTGKVEDYICLNWVGLKEKRLTDSEIEKLNLKIRQSFSSFGKSDNSWEVEVKIKNTIDFMLHCWQLK